MITLPAKTEWIAPSFIPLGGPPPKPEKRLKVLFFYQDFGAMGGIERYLIQTASLLRESGQVEPVIVCCHNTPLYWQLSALGFSVHGIHSPSVFSHSFLRTLDIKTLYRLCSILEAEEPDLIHVHIGLVENLLFKALGYPVAYTFHGYSTLYSMQDVRSPVKRLFKQFTRYLFRKTAKQMDALWFVSSAEQARMSQEGYLPDTLTGEVMHNALPIVEWQDKIVKIDRSSVLQKLGLAQKARCVTYINRLDDNKNPLQFIQMAQQLLQEMGNPKDLHFLIAGDGPLAEKVQTQCHASPNLHYLGYRTDIDALLAVSEFVVSTAQMEGFGLGLIEAMAAGVPCVTYATGGACEILNTPQLQDCLVPVNDFEALVAKAKTMLAQPVEERIRLRRALQLRSLDFDSWQFIKRLETEYRQLAPKISVILPVYNGGSFVLRAIDSVLNQTYKNLELIVVDDGSTDDTLVHLTQIQNPRVRVLAQENQGVAAARNYAFQQATGDYIAFIDADDLWLKHKLATELKTITENQNPQCLVYSSYYAVDEQDRIINFPAIYGENGNLAKAVLEHEGIFLPSTSLVHRSIFEEIGGFKAACYHEDRVFFIEACQQFPAYATRQRLVVYRQSLAGRCRSVLQNYEEALKAELSIVETLKPVLSKTEIALLAIRQKRNLLFRFLMYHYVAHAQTLHAELQDLEEADSSFFNGQKGRLAFLSLKTGINFLAGARLLFQACTRFLLMPWWERKMHSEHLLHSTDHL